MDIETARMYVAQAWCQENTKMKVMDSVIAEEFAKILSVQTSVPRLGLATTEQLLQEVMERIKYDDERDNGAMGHIVIALGLLTSKQLKYKTVDKRKEKDA